MKKYYDEPKLELMLMLSSDVITLSVALSGEDGDINDDYAPGKEPSEVWKYN